MTKLAIAIITYNRPFHIKEDLEWIFDATVKYGIDIYILDGSNNDETEKVVETYKKYNNFFYLNNSDIIFRTRYAFSKIDSEYICFSGDNMIVNPQFYGRIMGILDESVDVLTVYNQFANVNQGIHYYDDPAEFLDCVCAPLTHFGSTIINKKNVDLEIFEDSLKSDYDISAFSLQYMLIHSFPINGFRGCFIYNKDCRMRSKYITRSSTALGSGKMWNVWLKQWIRFIDLLPQQYHKQKLYSIMDENAFFFTKSALIQQRIHGEYNFFKVCDYREYIKKAVKCPIGWIYVYSLVPWWMLKAGIWLNNIIRGCIARLKRIIRK